MFRDASEELARLEAELLAAEEADEDIEEEYYDSDQDDEAEEAYEEEDGYAAYDEDDPAIYAGKFVAYNTDQTDEDLESYAEAVRTPKRSGCMPFLIVLLCLLTVSVVALVILILRQRGLL